MSKSEQFSGRYQPVKFRGYPVGTVAYYGPDDKLSQKSRSELFEEIIRNVPK